MHDVGLENTRQISMNVCRVLNICPGLRLENPQFLRSRVSPVCVCGWYDCNGCDVWLFDGCQPEPMHHLQSKRNISHSDTTPLDWTIKHMNVVECFKTHSSKIYFTNNKKITSLFTCPERASGHSWSGQWFSSPPPAAPGRASDCK